MTNFIIVKFHHNDKFSLQWYVHHYDKILSFMSPISKCIQSPPQSQFRLSLAQLSSACYFIFLLFTFYFLIWHLTFDIWHLTFDIWNLTFDFWLLTFDLTNDWWLIYIFYFLLFSDYFLLFIFYCLLFTFYFYFLLFRWGTRRVPHH